MRGAMRWLAAAMLALAATGHAAQPLTGGGADYDPLLAMIGDARVVMLGEATHGSREFHRERARITRRLILEKGFGAVVFEAPWEPVRRADAYIRGEGRDADAAAALGGLRRFPRWMWRNTDVRDFVESLRAINAGRPAPVRLYGMDLYSVPESADAVVRHVARRSIEAAVLARRRYACFDDFLIEPQLYGREVEAGRAPSCAEGAAAQLAELEGGGNAGADEDGFMAWQSARVVKNGEDYHRAMYRQGDARATDQAVAGETSLGQLMRERYGEAAVLVGLTTHRGRVRAATGWATSDRVKRLRPALPESWSGRLHEVGLPAFLLVFHAQASDRAGVARQTSTLRYAFHAHFTFIWTKSARDILQKVIRANSRLSSKQNAALH